ncbi:MAG TPA: hypothetical protein VF158_00210 [Longimicrobiales bacterium]
MATASPAASARPWPSARAAPTASHVQANGFIGHGARGLDNGVLDCDEDRVIDANVITASVIHPERDHRRPSPRGRHAWIGGAKWSPP